MSAKAKSRTARRVKKRNQKKHQARSNTTSSLETAQKLLGDGRLDEATNLAAKVLSNNPGHVDATHLLAVIAYRQGQHEKAIALSKVAIGGNPEDPSIYNTLGLAFQGMHQPEKALVCFQKALELNTGFVEAFYNLARAFRQLNMPDDARICYEKLLSFFPEDKGAWVSLADCYAAVKRWDDSIDACQKALAMDPDYATAYNNLSTAYFALGRNEEGRECAEKVKQLDPVLYGMTRRQIAVHLQSQGDLEKAAQYFREAVETNPTDGSAMLNLVGIKHIKTSDPMVRKAMQRADDDTVNEPDRVALNFALGRVHASDKQYDDAWKCYDRANRIRRKSIIYSHQMNSVFVTSLMDNFTRDLLESRYGQGVESDRPIFIVGMPRSGSTLLEQILASHPEVAAGGEMNHMPQILKGLPKRLNLKAGNHKGIIGKFEGEVARQNARDYLERTESVADGKRYCTDKLLGSFQFLGFFNLMLPNATILHCRRHPLDCILSCYFQRFALDLPFTWDLTDLGHFYLDYMKLMRHWTEVLPNKALDVYYEIVVSDTERQARRLLEHIGLEWNESVLEFYKAKHTVKTASVAQVRKPIYTQSMQKWRRYEKHIQPLIELLGDEIERYEADLEAMRDD